MTKPSTLPHSAQSAALVDPDLQAALDTPMMRQYQAIKQEYPDCLLLFRLGDFYELFCEDAKIGAQLLGIVLTSRDKKIPMAGIPYHAVEQYLPKFVQAGHKVAICEQVGQVEKGNKLVEREVIRIVTPGTVLDDKSLERKKNNYLVAVEWGSKQIGLALVDLSTAEFKTTQLSDPQTLLDEITRLQPAECLLAPAVYNDPAKLGQLKQAGAQNLVAEHRWEGWQGQAQRTLLDHFRLRSLRSLGLADLPAATTAAAVVLQYLRETQKTAPANVLNLTTYHPGESLVLDSSTIHNLELFATLREGSKEGSLLYQLDQTQTAMGGRLLHQWVRQPLQQRDEIEERLSSVEYWLTQTTQRERVQELLAGLADLERLLSRLALGQGTPPHLVQLQQSLERIITLKEELDPVEDALTAKLSAALSRDLDQVAQLIARTIDPDATIDPKSGGVIQDGVSAQLDELRQIIRHSQDWIKSLEKTEREQTGISSLKVRSNKVFGFYLEVTHTHRDKVPEYYERKQTLVNSERYITPQLKEHEEKLLTAAEVANDLEYELFCEVVEQVVAKLAALQAASQAIATLDCLAGLAAVAQRHNYCRPTFSNDNQGTITITQGRHPVVERLLPERTFVPNDVTLNTTTDQLHLITGPNMAGKSVYMRQVALIVLMAHIGSFVPAQAAQLCLVDRIFVRSGAADMITAGLSTFMVEMVETAAILRHATPNSLIIMDEIGRGTSTYDGISLAWAIASYLVQNESVKAKTLFATHYHELLALSEEFPNSIKNYHLAIEEQDGTPVFLYSIEEGGASHSYGLEVAELAGLPQPVIAEAKQLLSELKLRSHEPEVLRDTFTSDQKLEPWLEELQQLDLYQLTPLEALNLLAQWKKRGASTQKKSAAKPSSQT